jgi:uncharacterized membrane protein
MIIKIPRKGFSVRSSDAVAFYRVERLWHEIRGVPAKAEGSVLTRFAARLIEC